MPRWPHGSSQADGSRPPARGDGSVRPCAQWPNTLPRPVNHHAGRNPRSSSSDNNECPTRHRSAKVAAASPMVVVGSTRRRPLSHQTCSALAESTFPDAQEGPDRVRLHAAEPEPGRMVRGPSAISSRGRSQARRLSAERGLSPPMCAVTSTLRSRATPCHRACHSPTWRSRSRRRTGATLLGQGVTNRRPRGRASLGVRPIGSARSVGAGRPAYRPTRYDAPNCTVPHENGFGAPPARTAPAKPRIVVPAVRTHSSDELTQRRHPCPGWAGPEPEPEPGSGTCSSQLPTAASQPRSVCLRWPRTHRAGWGVTTHG